MSEQTKYCAYYRLSTEDKKKKLDVKLGIEAQKNAVNNFVQSRNGIILESYQEIESGKNDERPELLKALAYAKKHKATLIISKLDRLSRSVKFIFTLRDSGVDFICADMPEANTLTIGMLAVMAQYEREMISKRVKDALAVKSQQLAKEGKKLGSPDIHKATQASLIARKANIKPMTHIRELIIAKRNESKSYEQIANELNALKIKTSTNKQWTKENIRAVCNTKSPIEQREVKQSEAAL